MTVKELSQLYWLGREIEADQKRLDELEQLAASPSGAKLSGMPRAPFSGGSAVERLAAEIVDLQAIIAARQIQCIHERARLERWIREVPDSLTRQIFHLRFVDGLTWAQVAAQIGGGNTDAGVKMICYRYLKREERRAEAETERSMSDAERRTDEYERGERAAL